MDLQDHPEKAEQFEVSEEWGEEPVNVADTGLQSWIQSPWRRGNFVIRVEGVVQERGKHVQSPCGLLWAKPLELTMVRVQRIKLRAGR